jgi:hypothetical protein
MKIQIGDEVRDMTDAELAQVAIDQAEAQAQAAVLATKATARQAVLTKLKLTEAELTALLG